MSEVLKEKQKGLSERARVLAKLTAVFLSLTIPCFQNSPSAFQKSKEQDAIQHEVTVTLKLVQVYVTDKKGNPVENLEKEDFVIYDNGKKQTITEFERHLLRFPSAKIETQPEVIEESPLPAPRELLTRKFFLLFDFANNNARGIEKAKKAALHFIDSQLQPSDEVGVLSYSAIKSLTLHEYLTNDHGKVRKVVESFGMKKIAGKAVDLDEEIAGKAANFEGQYSRAIGGVQPLDASRKGGVSFDEIAPDDSLPREGLSESSLQAFHFSQKLADLAKALKYIPGYKHVILFSSGVPYSILYGVRSPYVVTRLGNPLLRQRFEAMLSELSSSNSTVYTLDTEDLATKIGSDSQALGAFTLQKMASSTGGKYFGNINSYEKHLAKIQNLTGFYYVLGYYIDEKWDGKYHEIRVEVSRPGCEVHAQKGYFNPKPFSEYSSLEKMLHLVDLALSEKPLFQTPIRFPMATFPCSVGKEMNLCLVAKIPLEKIEEILKGKVEIISVIFDKAENIVDFSRREGGFPKLPEHNIYYSFFSLSPGEYKCRLVIRNLETGRGAVAASPAVISERQEKGIELLPPLLLVSEKNAFYMKGSLPRGKAESFSLADHFHFDVTRYAPLVEDELQAGSVISAVMSYTTIETPELEVTISASLIDQSSGEIIPLQVMTRSETAEKELILRLVEIQIPELPSGEYVLNLTAEEAKSQSESQVTKIFKLK